MSIVTNDGCVRVNGQVTAEEAESLLHALRAAPAAALDLSECAGMHTAALQVVLALAPRICALPGDPWLAAVVMPLCWEAAP